MQALKGDLNGTAQLIFNRLLIRRNYKTGSKNFYEVLGLSRVSTHTQEDIKAAYYRLSMVYHPDKNKDSESAAHKFREITEAYKVLGNYRLRKLYDKGMLHTSGDQYQKRHEAPEQEDDPTTRFYKARLHKESRTATGRTAIYDFDEWTQAHYGSERERTQRLKQSAADRKMRSDDSQVNKSGEFTLLFMMILLIGSVMFKNESKDVDRIKKEKAESSDQ